MCQNLVSTFLTHDLRVQQQILVSNWLRMVFSEQGARILCKHTILYTDHETFTAMDVIPPPSSTHTCSLLFFNEEMFSTT